MQVLSVWFLAAAASVVLGLAVGGVVAWVLFRRARTADELRPGARPPGGPTGPEADHARLMRHGERVGAAAVAVALVLGLVTATYGYSIRSRLTGDRPAASASGGADDLDTMAVRLATAVDGHDEVELDALTCGRGDLLGAARTTTDDVDLLFPLVSGASVEVLDGDDEGGRAARLTASATVAGVTFRLDGSLRLVRDPGGRVCVTAGSGPWQVVFVSAADDPSPQPVDGLPVSRENCGRTPEEIRDTVAWTWYELADPAASGEPVLLDHAALGFCSAGHQDAVFAVLAGGTSRQALYTAQTADLAVETGDDASTLRLTSQPVYWPLGSDPTPRERDEWLGQEAPVLVVTASREPGGYVVDSAEVTWVSLGDWRRRGGSTGA